jgi:hypothetical protein
VFHGTWCDLVCSLGLVGSADVAVVFVLLAFAEFIVSRMDRMDKVSLPNPPQGLDSRQVPQIESVFLEKVKQHNSIASNVFDIGLARLLAAW